MIIWVLMWHLAGAHGPYMAFTNQDDCEQANQSVPAVPADCVAFAADAVMPTPKK